MLAATISANLDEYWLSHAQKTIFKSVFIFYAEILDALEHEM